MNNWVKNGGHRQSRKVEISRQDEGQKMDCQSRKIEITSEEEFFENDRQPRKVEIKDEDVLFEKDRQPRKVKVNSLQELFVSEFSVYPLSMSRKASERISFFSKTTFAESESIFAEGGKVFTEEETQSLFSKKNI